MLLVIWIKENNRRSRRTLVLQKPEHENGAAQQLNATYRSPTGLLYVNRSAAEEEREEREGRGGTGGRRPSNHNQRLPAGRETPEQRRKRAATRVLQERPHRLPEERRSS